MPGYTFYNQNHCLNQITYSILSIYLKSNNLVEKVREAFIGGLKGLTWMDEITKLSAEDKAKAIIQKIGYPEFIMDNKQLDEHYKGVS